jgi:hypothetical protein
VIDVRIEARNEAVRKTLGTVTSDLTPLGSSGWRFAMLNGSPHVVTARIEDDWLMFEADYASEAQGSKLYWDALVRSASLAGLVKLVVAREGSLRLSAELPLLEDVDLTTRVQETCSGFEAGWMRQAGHSSPELSSANEMQPIDLKGLCSEAGWPCVERGGRKLAVELEVPGGFSQALLVPTEHGVRISCEIATLDAVTEECRHAIGGFLLAASGLVRMGRASVSTVGPSPVAQFEVVFGTVPSPSEISSALESLSVGCSLCGEEIKVLQNPVVAEHYLALRGWGTSAAARRNERTVTV